ncbi:sigma-54 factor interaction domain-containing protein [Rossellomorea vietnamensis]|uniref:Sigma-54 factor interaction domain-containing protein n=1 Tax=Rossellomorea vietnamensis TaxID=218284 RepID=A0A5D4NRD0_9BACI|nr:sigma-54 factor interaction domain-containing protein [Rossellomorea vietnamensis]
MKTSFFFLHKFCIQYTDLQTSSSPSARVHVSKRLTLGHETGTGKELFSSAIHNESSRKHDPFLVINCGALPDYLFESELFGYEEGALLSPRQ